MWLTKILTAVLAIATGLLPSSCTKAKAPKVQNPAPAISTASLSTTNKNLGDLALTNHYETCVDLGMGKSCTFRPTQLDHSSLKLTMVLESRNTTGGTKDLSVVQVVAESGKPFEIAVGDMNLTLTPKLQGDQ
jgi:hypothetical protein